MKLFKCDHCGADVPGADVVSLHTFGLRVPMHQVDLCPECARQVQEYITAGEKTGAPVGESRVQNAFEDQGKATG